MKSSGFLLIVVAIFTFSCTHRTENKNLVNNKVVLRVANVSITEYELEKNLKRFKDAYHEMNLFLIYRVNNLLFLRPISQRQPDTDSFVLPAVESVKFISAC